MEKIDARGEACPKPVILTKKQLDSMEEGVVETRVDNDIAVKNLSKLATSSGLEYKVETLSGEDFKVQIIKGKGSVAVSEEDKDDFANMTLAFSSDKMGRGSEELGHILMKSLMYTVTETEPLPKTMIFYNEGINLTCTGSEVLEDLKALEEKGVEIISCGTCLDFYRRADEVEVGEVSNMYTIYESLKNPEKTVIIG